MIPTWLKLATLSLGLGLVLAVAAGAGQATYERRVYLAIQDLQGQVMDRPLPPLVLYDLQGRPLDLNSDAFRDKVIFLNIWASYCKPCKEELPSMVRLAQQMEREADDFVLLAVSWDEEPEELGAFLAAFPEVARHMVIARDPGGEQTRQLGTRLLPETYIVDQDRRIVARFQSIRPWDAAESVRLFTSLIRRHR